MAGNDFGTLLRRRRQAAGLSQRSLAKLSGVHQPVISLIEAGAREASPRVRAALSSALALRPSEVLPRLRERALTIITRRGGSDVRVFGSVARGTDHPGSDVDLLVRLEPGRDIVDLLALEEELSDLFTFDVNVIADDSTGAVIERARREAVAL
ncbi:MAG: helix-turn-helix domain-containing protein [Micropruina sp.]|nr:helix-turn-helix domain-containing protein [Micropruina sp.]